MTSDLAPPEESDKTLAGTDLLAAGEKPRSSGSSSSRASHSLRVRARDYGLREASLSLLNGARSPLAFPLRSRADTFMNGELAADTAGQDEPATARVRRAHNEPALLRVTSTRAA